MKAVTKLDERLRGIFPSIFSPGDILERVIASPDTVTFKLLKSADAPLVKSRKWRGKLMGTRSKISSATIATAVRTDRDAR